MSTTTSSTRPRPTPGVYAPNTQAAVDRLSQGKPGDAITEDEITSIIGEPCKPNLPGYSVVTRAINYVRRDFNVVWQRDRTIPGWRCLDPSERVKLIKQSGAKRVSRLARRNLQVLAVDSAKLTPEEKRDQQILQVTQGMVLASSAPQFRRQVAGRIAEWDKLHAPAPAQLIELMRPAQAVNGKPKV